MAKFKAIVIEKADKGQTVSLTEFDEANLMDGDVTVRVDWSTINYKDGLAITGKAPVVRRFPMIPGIDFAGEVEASSHPDWKPGDKVILNGWGLGETHLGAYAEKARVKGHWLVRLPAGMSAREAMAIGTAGYTAMLAVMALERHGLKPGAGPGGGHRRGRRRRLGRDRAPGQARLPGDRLDRPAARRPTTSRASAPPRSSTATSSSAPPQAARQGALGRRHRLGRLHDARQRAVDDEIWRRGRGLRPRRRHGPAGQRRAVHFARSVAFGHRFRPCVRRSSRNEAWRRLESDLDRGKLEEMTREIGLSEVIGDGRHHPGRPGSGADRGQDPVKTFRIWLRTSGMIGSIVW